MKAFLVTALLLSFLDAAFATDYYFAANGNDSRSAAEASNSSTPWQSITKLNSIASTLKAGDRVLFRRGDTFYGSIQLKTSGTSSKPITLTAYGTGDKPVITGLVELTGWVSKGGGIYEATNSSIGSTLNVVTINNVLTPMGRYPNRNATYKGYLTFESHGSKTITDKELTSSTNWTGAELVLRTHHWIIDRLKITSHSGSTITYTGTPTYSPINGYGYFIQNHIKTLDQFGEWCYNSSTKKVSMYFGSASPSNYKIKASVKEDLVYINNQDYIVFDDLAFFGSNETNIDIYSSDGTIVRNCDIENCGLTGVFAQNTNNLLVENSIIKNTNSNGIDLYSNTDNTIIRNNTIKNAGSYAGMGPNGNHSNHGLRANGNGNLIEYNTIDSAGYCGIRFTGDNTNIRNNLISNFCFVKDDGGGIYTGITDGVERFGRKITNNIVLNGIGSREGTTASVVQQVSGIYLDNNSSGVVVSGNTVSNCGKVGLYVHNSYKITVTGNTMYNNTGQGMVNHDDAKMSKVTNVSVKNNVFFSRMTDQLTAYYYTRLGEMKSFGTIDSNYYARPFDDNITIQAITGLYTSSQKIVKHTLETWKPVYGHDPHSKKSPKTFTSTFSPSDYIRFEYNASKNSKDITLDGTYVDVKNKSYSGKITLAPYASIVLIKTGSVVVPDAKPVVVITSPVVGGAYTAPGTVQLTATATMVGSSISKVEFYEGTKLLATEKTAPYNWKWSNVPSGSYTITAKATAANGATNTSAPVNITVGDANLVELTSPVVGTSYTASASIQITASALLAGRTVSKVQFYNGTTLLRNEGTAPYNWIWTKVPAGTYTITAKAIATDGFTVTSLPVTVTVKSAAASAAMVESFDDQAQAFAQPEASASKEFKLYPNPVINRIQLEFGQMQANEKAQVSIRNTAGGTVMNVVKSLYGKYLELDASTLRPGVYVLSVTGSTGTQSRTFVKE